MSDLKTKQTEASPSTFISSISDDKKRSDANTLLTIMSDITQQPPAMWGDSLIGFGLYKYQYASGRKGEWFRVGFSPRKQNITLYIMNGFSQYQHLLERLGKHKTGKSCLYISKLEDIDVDVLKQMIALSYQARFDSEI
ncbi:DUF1801 domain-containing protein [Psychrosphaera aestuarii]|uniref:DUF1801 domain-containing protein n=1 Tax=Psychrosphaera aestuarii TaxID=1266052 RepID=UPI001B33A48D|nr:DUF1801 domain-containing protein [Psychrosphaera aestuarii]